MRLNGHYVADISRACVVNPRLTIKIKLNLRPRAFSELSASVALLGRKARVSRPRHIATGNVAEMAEIAGLSRPSADNGANKRLPARADSAQNSPRAGFAALAAVPVEEWRTLAERAIEPNGYYLPAWELAVNASASGRTGVFAIGAWRDASPNELAPSQLAPSDDPAS